VIFVVHMKYDLLSLRSLRLRIKDKKEFFGDTRTPAKDFVLCTPITVFEIVSKCGSHVRRQRTSSSALLLQSGNGSYYYKTLFVFRICVVLLVKFFLDSELGDNIVFK
jgi:hypothetical protein